MIKLIVFFCFQLFACGGKVCCVTSSGIYVAKRGNIKTLRGSCKQIIVESGRGDHQ